VQHEADEQVRQELAEEMARKEQVKRDKEKQAKSVVPLMNPTLADFVLGRILGQGSFGKVYHCKRRATGDEYAVKVMSKRLIAKEDKVLCTPFARAPPPPFAPSLSFYSSPLSSLVQERHDGERRDVEGEDASYN
jgi:serine/threonine protein kinase